MNTCWICSTKRTSKQSHWVKQDVDYYQRCDYWCNENTELQMESWSSDLQGEAAWRTWLGTTGLTPNIVKQKIKWSPTKFTALLLLKDRCFNLPFAIHYSRYINNHIVGNKTTCCLTQRLCRTKWTQLTDKQTIPPLCTVDLPNLTLPKSSIFTYFITAPNKASCFGNSLQ